MYVPELIFPSEINKLVRKFCKWTYFGKFDSNWARKKSDLVISNDGMSVKMKGEIPVYMRNSTFNRPWNRVNSTKTWQFCRLANPLQT